VPHRAPLFTVRQFLKGAETTSGHVPGMYMSYYIEQNGLKKDLLQHLDDPFLLFHLTYNKAAKKDKQHKAYVFSDTSVKLFGAIAGEVCALITIDTLPQRHCEERSNPR
jgi:hypothetical protein